MTGVEIVLGGFMVGGLWAFKRVVDYLSSGDSGEEEDSPKPAPKVLGTVLPRQQLYIPPHNLQPPRTPLWENHRLLELERPAPHIPDYRTLVPPLPRKDTLVSPIVDRAMQYEPLLLEPIIPSISIQSAQDDIREREDPFARGEISGWTYEDGRRRGL